MFTKPLRLVGDGQINLRKMTDENKETKSRYGGV